MIRKALGFLMMTGTVAFFVVACGGDDDEATAKYPTADSFCTARAAEECKAISGTCAGLTDEACNRARKSACDSEAGSATGGGRTYTAAKSEECITKTTAAFSTRIVDPAKEKEYVESCGRVFSGTKTKGQGCENAYDCTGTLVCDLDKKLCAEKRSVNENDGCANAGEICADGLYCQTPQNLCKPRRKVAESCNVTTEPCLSTLRCDGTQCKDLIGAGQPCDTNPQCSSNFCLNKLCAAKQYPTATGTCKDFGGT